MIAPYIITPDQLRESADKARALYPELSQRLADRADEMENNERRETLKYEYDRAVMVHGLRSHRAAAALEALQIETHGGLTSIHQDQSHGR